MAMISQRQKVLVPAASNAFLCSFLQMSASSNGTHTHTHETMKVDQTAGVLTPKHPWHRQKQGEHAMITSLSIPPCRCQWLLCYEEESFQEMI